jgi:hypothetical protein
VTTIHHWNHDNSFACVLSYSTGIVTQNPALLEFPLASVEVHVGSAYAACLKLHQYPSAFNFGFRDFFNFDVVGSTVYSGFQKESTSNYGWVL